MRTELSERARADLRRALGEMESLAPLPPELETRPVELRTEAESTPRPLLVTVGAAAVVFALVLPIALLSGNRDVVDDASQTVPPPTQAETTAPEPEPTTTALVNGWAITDAPGLGSVIGTTDEGSISISMGLVHTSDDGVVWQPSGSLGEGASAIDIEHHEGTLVAAGVVISEEEDGGRAHSPAVWTSTDGGVTWTQNDLGVKDVTTTPDGFVAVGIEKRDDSDPTYSKTRGVLWTSADGLSWTRVAATDDPEGISSSFSNVVWNGQVVILGHRGPDYVSEGSGLEDSVPHETVTWFSDGTDLSEPVPSNLVGNLDANQTAVTPHGIIAMTHWMTPTVKTVAAAWISDDGTTWTEINIDPGNYEYTDIGQFGDEVFITGYDLSGRDDTGLWSTLDGADWTRLELPDLPEFTTLSQVEVSESALVIAGDQSSGIIASRPRP
jgi:photosystem II stability/assembly factor-like uncharacterized protein